MHTCYELMHDRKSVKSLIVQDNMHVLVNTPAQQLSLIVQNNMHVLVNTPAQQLSLIVQDNMHVLVNTPAQQLYICMVQIKGIDHFQVAPHLQEVGLGLGWE